MPIPAPESVDVRRITSETFTTDLPALAAAAVAIRNPYNQGNVYRLIELINRVADVARDLHL